MSDVGSGTAAVIPVSDDEATLLFDTMGEVWGFTLQNIDAANAVYVSQDRTQLNSTQGIGGANVPNVGILLGANGGSWTVMFFRGRMWGLALNADVGLRCECWPVYMFDPATVSELLALMRNIGAKAKSA
jgi:hypothetical protein